ncbi:class I SAM-dependent methyltransferase [Candidatus Latescibacterota bacterium]
MPGKKEIHTYYNDVAGQYNYDFYVKDDPYPPLRYRHRYTLDLVDGDAFPDNPKALDIGCGPGEMVLDLAVRGFETWGIDISEEMIVIARNKADKHRNIATMVHYETGDIERLRFEDGTFDLIVAAGVVEYLQTDNHWVVELFRLLKPGGILILNVTNRYSVNRLTAGIFEKLKGNRTVMGVMQFLKKNILKRGDVVRFPFKPRTHSPRKFDRFLHDNGFTKTAHRYFAFSVLPYPLDTLLSIVTVPVRKYLERFAASNMVLFGTGYIVKARKVGRS